MTKCTSGGCDQFETSSEAIDQELRTAFCERRHTDRLKTNYRIDVFVTIYQMMFRLFLEQFHVGQRVVKLRVALSISSRHSMATQDNVS